MNEELNRGQLGSKVHLRQILRVGCCGLFAASLHSLALSEQTILKPANFAHYVETFNAMENEPVVNLIPNTEAWKWMADQIPLFNCPSKRLEETYYFRWWTFRKHIKQTPDGLVLTEFIRPVSHAGKHNTISCAFGHHVAEGRWLRDRRLLDDYTRFWFRSGKGGGVAKHFHKYSNWAAAALYDRYLVTLDREFLLDLLDDLIADYRVWESERFRPDGLFWQYDVQDGMEESISGGRRMKNVRPTINSYMVANARAIARIADMAGRSDVADEFNSKSERLRTVMLDAMWDPDAQFFKVQFEEGGRSDAREAIGFIPWMFDLAGRQHAEAWLQIKDSTGFWAPWGLTTAERRHPTFRSRGTGTCEWDGAVWPFASSQTLNGLANVIRGPDQPYVTRRDFFEQVLTYARAHQLNEKAYIGEYHDEISGRWLITGPKAERSRYYNHSTFNDLIIRGVVGIVPREGDTLEIDPLIPADAWNWFCLDGVSYHGHRLSIVWDRTGARYGRGAGLSVWVENLELGRSAALERLTVTLPGSDRRPGQPRTQSHQEGTSEDAIRETVPTVSFASGRLQYNRDQNGNCIPDFSHCGYQGADIPVPSVAPKVSVSPSDGDDTHRIQRAVDHVAGLPLGRDGFRGAVLLEPGEFQVGGSIRIRASGIVLQGCGAGTGGTTIRATGRDRRTLIRVTGEGVPTPTDSPRQIVDEYAPVGIRTIALQSTTGLRVGDFVIVTRPSSEEWIQSLGCDAPGIGWRAGSRDVRWDRKIGRIMDNSVELDAPLTTAIEKRFGGGTIQRYRWPGRVERVGIEDLRLVSDYDGDNENPYDEEHSWFGVVMQTVVNAWVRRVEFRHFAGGSVMLGDRTKWVTVSDCIAEEPISEVGGYRRHTFFTQGQQCLFLRCWSKHGRHDFSVGHCSPGPNAFVNCYAEEALGESGPLESWASGVLYDNVRIDGADLRLGNRWSSPARTGWSAANCVLWQCQAANIHCHRPPTANNWAIGIWATPAGDGLIDQVSSYVKPLSLYQQQVRERLGDEAATDIGPFLLKPTSATNPTLEEAAEFVQSSARPARQLIDLIRERWETVGIRSGANAPTAPAGVAKPNDVAPNRRLALQNGWLVVDSKLKTGSHLTPTWWRGSLHPEQAPSFGPAITRFVPGRIGTGLTDELSQVAAAMLTGRVASYDHHYGLWYDRRRDDHLMVRRSSGDVVPPFYEQPFARTGNGTAWDGLSRYDLTRFNPWYWNRLDVFAQLCDRHGLVLFHHNYFQHNILEAGAHWTDSPWRPANHVNDTGLPEPPPYIGDKRIFLAQQFYDITDDRRQELHRNYIRQCLSRSAGRSNVIQLTSAEYTGPLPFMQFWLDTIIEWKRETGQKVLVALSCTKDVQDAILADTLRGPHVDVIDIRYWSYTEEDELYAPCGGQNLSPRQHLRQQKPASTSFASIVRAVREYRIKYPQKAVTYYADLHCRSERDGWAVLIGGGSLPNLPALPDELTFAIPRLRPSASLKLAPQQWCLADGNREFLVFSAARDVPATINVPRGLAYRCATIDPVTGHLNGPFETISQGRITVSKPSSVIWVRQGHE